MVLGFDAVFQPITAAVELFNPIAAILHPWDEPNGYEPKIPSVTVLVAVGSR
jgi:hypothetical protein